MEIFLNLLLYVGMIVLGIWQDVAPGMIAEVNNNKIRWKKQGHLFIGLIILFAVIGGFFTVRNIRGERAATKLNQRILSALKEKNIVYTDTGKGSVTVVGNMQQNANDNVFNFQAGSLSGIDIKNNTISTERIPEAETFLTDNFIRTLFYFTNEGKLQRDTMYLVPIQNTNAGKYLYAAGQILRANNIVAVVLPAIPPPNDDYKNGTHMSNINGRIAIIMGEYSKYKKE